jgi:hypothetical protein
LRAAGCVLLMVATLSLGASAQSAPRPYLYRASLVQAAPGKLLELIELYKSRAALERANSGADETPLWMRHSQGDRWDLLVLTPMGSYAEHYRAERVAARQKAERTSDWEAKRRRDVAWEEDVFVFGPPVEELRKAFAEAGFFHVEMFRALPGRQNELLKEREMENAYSRAIKQPENFIFVRDQGAAWDSFTIGCFRDVKHYAQGGDVPAKDREAAAKSAGFENVDSIGLYLRIFIAEHHDTLAVAVK